MAQIISRTGELIMLGLLIIAGFPILLVLVLFLRNRERKIKALVQRNWLSPEKHFLPALTLGRSREDLPPAKIIHWQLLSPPVTSNDEPERTCKCPPLSQSAAKRAAKVLRRRGISCQTEEVLVKSQGFLGSTNTCQKGWRVFTGIPVYTEV